MSIRVHGVEFEMPTLCIDSFKETPYFTFKEFIVLAIYPITTARFCKACPWKEPGFNVPANARMGWLSFLGLVG